MMLNRIGGGGLVILVCSAVAACADSVVQPEDLARRVAIAGSASRTGAAFICQTAIRTADDRHPWRYGSVAVRFPAPERATDGRTMIYRYEGYDDENEMMSLAVCRIPATVKAIRRMNQLLKVNAGEGSSDLDAATAGYAMERLVVTACASGYTGEYPYCLPNPTPVEMPADGSSSGWWGGESVPPPPPDAAEPDLAGDTVPSGVIPDCTQPQEQPWARAYCRADPPTGERLVRTDSSLVRVARRGPECAHIAQMGRELLATGRLQYYQSMIDDGASGWGDPGIGVLLSSGIVDNFGNPGNPSLVAFDRVLVHEIEHTMGREHIDSTGRDTPNSRLCSGWL